MTARSAGSDGSNGTTRNGRTSSSRRVTSAGTKPGRGSRARGGDSESGIGSRRSHRGTPHRTAGTPAGGSGSGAGGSMVFVGGYNSVTPTAGSARGRKFGTTTR